MNTQDVVNSFLRKEKCRKVNNTVTDGESLFYHGNKIAWFNNDLLHISYCGWNTKTTRERLNMLPDVHVKCSKGTMYFKNPYTEFWEIWESGYKIIHI